ncbi:tail fiber protein [soil metagenome]
MTQPFMGEIRFFSYDFPPRGWATCSGQLLSIQQNSALFSLLGTQYGGNGIQTFALPDLRSRVPMHRSPGVNPQGTVSGSENVTLLQSQVPPHTHNLMGTSAAGNARAPVGRTFSADTSDNFDFYATGNPTTTLAPASIATAGGSQPHPNVQPYLTLNASIALQGIFPSRN